MVDHGADIIDIGGESTRPGASPIDDAEEQRRVMPVIEGLAGRVKRADFHRHLQSVDRRCRAAAGASIVNDISGLRYEPELADVVARRGAAIDPDAHSRPIA